MFSKFYGLIVYPILNNDLKDETSVTSERSDPSETTDTSKISKKAKSLI